MFFKYNRVYNVFYLTPEEFEEALQIATAHYMCEENASEISMLVTDCLHHFEYCSWYNELKAKVTADYIILTDY